MLAAARRRTSRSASLELGAARERALVRLDRAAPGRVALARVGLPAAAVVRRLPGARVELDELASRPRRAARGRGRRARRRRRARASSAPRRARPSASRWFVGSSSSTTSKRAVRRAARPARAAWPPDSERERAVEQVGAEAELGRGGGEARLGVVAAEREPALERGRVRLERVEVAGREAPRPARRRAAAGGGDADALEDRRAHGRAARRRRRRSRAAAGSRRCRARGRSRRRARSRPARMRSSVDLPDPFGPISAMRLPASTRRSTRVEEGAGAVVAGDAAGVEEGRRHAGSFRGEGRRKDSREPAVEAGRSWRLSASVTHAMAPRAVGRRYRADRTSVQCGYPPVDLASSLHASAPNT